MRSYSAAFTITVDLDIDESLFARIREADWASTFYDLTDLELVHMLSRSMGLNYRRLSDLDGFADLDDGLVRVTSRFESIESIEEQ